MVWASFFRCRIAAGTAFTGRKISGLQDWEIGINIQFILIFFYFFYVKVMIKSQFSDRAMKKQMKRGVAKRCVSFFFFVVLVVYPADFQVVQTASLAAQSLYKIKSRSPHNYWLSRMVVTKCTFWTPGNGHFLPELNTKKALIFKAWQHSGIKCLRFMPREEKGHKRG